jgi:hypothetical protein
MVALLSDLMMPNVLATNRIVNLLVLSAAVLVLEWTVISNSNIDHRKIFGYGGCSLVKISAD